MDRLARIFWLGTKELRSLRHDRVVIALLVFSFTFSVYVRAQGTSSEVHRATIGLVDEDRSTLSRRIAEAIHPPYFLAPVEIAPDAIDRGMDAGRFMFVLDVPPRFEADWIAGREPEIALHVDATTMTQAGIGAHYLRSIVARELARSAEGPLDQGEGIRLVTRTAFNPNRSSAWFHAIVTMIDHVTMLTIVLTGAALIREREHGTIEHLLAMPLTSLEIAASKIWANGLVILASAALSLVFVVEGVLGVPIAGSKGLFLAGTTLYLFFATALGVFLGTVARSMAQFALLVLLVVMPLDMLSGAMTPIESQPAWLQRITFLLPSRHFVSFSEAILFRGAGIGIVWRDFAIVSGLGLLFFVLSLMLFRRSIAAAKA
ncbi:MAG TPA: ABC transporter permease [Planctomycetota bacterium]|nr:ABC transporter permease [Planctomycetota bacterium]